MDERALARPGHAGHDDEHAEGDVDVDRPEVVGVGAADLEHAGRRPDRWLQGRPVVEMAAGERAAGPQSLDGPLEHDLAAGRAGARPEIHDVVTDGDGLRLVLDDEDRVALVAELPEEAVHPLDVVRMEPDRRFVEDVGDVGQRRSEMADHLRPLGLATRECAG